jgi:hypothetical protein
MNRASFEPASLPGFFPFAPTPEAIRALLPSDIPVDDILASSRPAGAADVLRPDQSETQPSAAPRRESVAHRLAQAEAAIRTGNFVRAAIRFEQSGDRNRALQQLDADLLPKLGPLFGWDADRTKAWRQALASVLSRAAQGHWPHAARLLFDLQTLAHDLSGELYNVDLPGAILSLGRKPVRRKMTHARDVLIHQKLLSVERHLDKSHLTHDEEAAVAVLLSHERKLVEDRLRRTLGPVIEAQLTDAGIIPLNRAETISRDAVVAELPA